MAVVVSLLAAMLLTCVGVALALLGSAAATLALHDGQAVDATYAAQAALSLASGDLRNRPDWNGVLAAGTPADLCASPGRFVDGSMSPGSPWDGSALDLHALTAQRQTDSDAAAPSGVSGPVWRLFDYGPISRLAPSDARRHPVYVVVWAAGGRDGRLLLHATALGRAGLRASAETSLRPAGAAAAARLATRTVR